MQKKGFTLIELIVVIAIIAILAAIVAPNAFKAVEKAKISGSIEDFRSIKTGAMAYYSDVGTWPSNCTTPSACANTAGFVSQPTNVTGWDGPYLEKWPQTSKWGGNYTFTRNDAGTLWNATAAGERYVNITNAPAVAASKIDSQLDGTVNNTQGDVRYPGGSGVQSVGLIVSRDGPVD